MSLITNLTQQQVNDVEDHVKRELGCEEGEEPLRRVHMSLQTHIQEMVVQVRYIFLFKTQRNKLVKEVKQRRKLCRISQQKQQLYPISEDKHFYCVRSDLQMHKPA